MRRGLDRELNVLDVLLEGISFIIRASLLRILEENLLDHFASGTAAEAYFGGAGLTRRGIEERRRPQAAADDEE
jgi:hypothetical protein